MPDPSTLQDLIVDRAVRTLTGRYCDAVACFDAAGFATLWTEDADWVVPGARTTSGRERIGRLFARLRGDYALCTQELLSGVVRPEPDGDAAEARWHIREFQWKPDGAVSCVMGIYTDRVVFVDDAWMFARRQFDVLYRGPVNLSGSVTPVAPPA